VNKDKEMMNLKETWKSKAKDKDRKKVKVRSQIQKENRMVVVVQKNNQKESLQDKANQTNQVKRLIDVASKIKLCYIRLLMFDLSEDELSSFKKAFDLFDKDGNGDINKEV